MTQEERRRFLAQGAAVTAGLFAGRATAQEAPATQQNAVEHAAGHPADSQEFPRMQPGLGGPVGSPTDRGKLVAGYRSPDEPPVRVTAPDLTVLQGKLVNGVREFHLRATRARRELLPGIWMDAYGYNDLFPGPVLEMNQGERVRIVFRNELPEETTLHSHGLELPVSMDGIPAVTQNYVKPGETFVYE